MELVTTMPVAALVEQQELGVRVVVVQELLMVVLAEQVQPIPVAVVAALMTEAAE